MKRSLAAILALVAVGLLAPAAAPGQSAIAPAPSDADRYSLANGCFALRSGAAGPFVAKAGSGYRAAASSVGAAEGFRMQATHLGSYLLYGRGRDFVSRNSEGRVASSTEATPDADWRVDEAGGGTYKLFLPPANRYLAVGGGGDLVLAGAGEAGTFTFEEATGCPGYPEVEVSATGQPLRGPTPDSEVAGLIDAHIHMMAFEFLGGRAHCGRPWHAYGAPHALVDCPDHYPGQGGAAVLENVLYGNPARQHDPVGWPTFKDWPHHESLTHEQTYYKWLERAWLGGLRVYVNLLVENGALCELYPYKQNSCVEMDSIRLQAKRMRELEDYIDAQNGGPGKGWFRIVLDPFEARRVINEGKLAVVMGIENSKLFDCGHTNYVPECNAAAIDRGIEEVHRMGVRDMEIVNKFDNGFAGVAGDAGSFGVVVNNGNKYETNTYWDMKGCPSPGTDKPQFGAGDGRDPLVANGFAALLPPGATPLYAEPPHCNRRGLTQEGVHLINRMIEKKMIIDPDHLSVAARNHVLSLIEAADYGGVVSSHSWSTEDSYPRIYRLGGLITPYAGSSKGFVDEWRKVKPKRDARFYFGFGYGADMNGFGSQGGPRNGPNPVTYPFKSFDGGVTFDKQRSGSRVFDINVDGVAHYGLYPDWVEDLRRIAGQEIVDDMARGSEAYLQMWERAEGARPTYRACRPRHDEVTRRGLDELRLGAGPKQLLLRAGQPSSRVNGVWRYCVQSTRNPAGDVIGVVPASGELDFVATTAPGHHVGRIRPGIRASRISKKAKRLTRSVRMRKGRGGVRFLYGVRRGRVRWVAVASRSASSSRARLRTHLRTAGLS